MEGARAISGIGVSRNCGAARDGWWGRAKEATHTAHQDCTRHSVLTMLRGVSGGVAQGTLRAWRRGREASVKEAFSL